MSSGNIQLTFTTVRNAFKTLTLNYNLPIKEHIRCLNQEKNPARLVGLGNASHGKGRVPYGKQMHKRIKASSRIEMMNPESTDWSSIYSAAESYNPSVIPVPIRMGRPSHNRTGDVPPDSKGNVELLKIPNFFHLAPPAIKKHCEALQEYCTPWPEDLIDRPIRVTTINHIYAGPSIRHPNSRMVKLQVYLKDLDLDDHAFRKMTLLVGDRYNTHTDELTIITDKCPTRKQNKDYAYYLLTALYHESWKKEDWEDEAIGISDEEIRKEIAKVKAELDPKSVVEKQRHRRRYEIINGKMIRYNNVGHPFLYELGKHGIKGALTKDEIRLAKERWKAIQTDSADDNFDPIFHRDSESEFKYLL